MFPTFYIVACLIAQSADARPGDATVRLTVQPMASPRPALKYQLLPEVREMKPGNPAQWYIRCFMEQRNFFFNKESVAQRASYRSMPLARLPAPQLRGYGGSALTQADYGARLDAIDWQVLDRVQSEGADLSLPELASFRILGEALQVRFRGEVARREFDAAIVTAKTMLGFARHLGEHPTTAANLIGLAIAEMATDTLLEMVQQPGCPNLYWALTDLPCPVVELRKGFQGDRAIVDSELRALRTTAMTEAEVESLVSRLSGRAGFAREQAGLPPRNLRTELAAQAKNSKALADAQLRLLAGGALRILTCSPLQVVLLDEKRQYESRRDELLKLQALSPAQIDGMPSTKISGIGVFDDLLPRVVEGRRAQGRLAQRIALLRHIEALRLYSAKHDGKLPARLDEIALPLPADPFTDKPFEYTRNGATALLRGGSRYEITIGK